MLTLFAVLLAAMPVAPAGGAPVGQPTSSVPALAARLDAAPLEQGLEMVRVGTIANATDAPFYLAQERGYLRELGLDMETSPFNSAQLMIPPLGADQLDVGGGAPGPGLFNAISRGVNVRIVTDRARAIPGTRFNCLVARKSLLDSGALRDFADLRGRVFAENVPGVITTYPFERELQRVGLTLQDVSTTSMAFPDMVPAFANEAIDVAFLVEPFITLGEQRGFMVAYLRAVRDYYRAFFGDGQGRGDLLQTISRITGSRDMGLLERLAPSWMDPNGSVNVESLRAVQRWYLGRGEVTTEVDFDRVVDRSFVDNALGQLGRVPAP
jgi:NitT/TauT family transport system substrate-binding protein